VAQVGLRTERCDSSASDLTSRSMGLLQVRGHVGQPETSVLGLLDAAKGVTAFSQTDYEKNCPE